LHNEELHNLYTSYNIIGAIKSRKMRWAGHVITYGEGEKSIQNFSLKTSRKETSWEDSANSG
jgi:hypothetical protein